MTQISWKMTYLNISLKSSRDQWVKPISSIPLFFHYFYGPFVRRIHRPPVNSRHKGQWSGTLMFFLDLCLNKGLSKQSWWGWCFEMPSDSLWHHCNVKPQTTKQSTTESCAYFVGQSLYVSSFVMGNNTQDHMQDGNDIVNNLNS